MKRFLIIFGLIFCIALPASAKNIKVEAMSDFSTANPPETWEVKVTESIEDEKGFSIPAGSIISGYIKDVTDPKRLKRNAKFKFIPYEVSNPLTGEITKVKRNFVGKYSSLTDVTPFQVVKKGAVTAGNHFISGVIGPSVALVEGAVKNEQGNRAKSAAISVYESTPLSYVETGKELEIKAGQVFVMSFKTKDNADDDADDSAEGSAEN